MQKAHSLLLTGLFSLGLAGCNPSAPSVSTASTSAANSGAAHPPTSEMSEDPNTLACLSGSELESVQPLLPRLEKETGVRLVLNSTGTLASVEKLQNGAGGYDCGWFSHNKYLMLSDNKIKGIVVASERIMISPVILGVKADKAKALKWTSDNTTWADVAKAANAGTFTFAMTSPATSNTGMSALIGVTAALSGTESAINEESIKRIELSGFGKGHLMYADSSAWLTTAFANELANPQGPDGIVNYESELLRLNATKHANLTLIYPKEGIVTADYPLMLFNVKKKAQYDKVIAFFKRDDIQKVLMTSTYRRPVSANVSADPALFGDHLLVEVGFPARLATVDSLLMSYQNKQRRPAHVYFVLDTSGSMGRNGGIEQLRAAMVGLTGADSTVTGRFAQFRGREQVTVVEFASKVKHRTTFSMGTDPAANKSVLADLAKYSYGLAPAGGTAIYDAVVEAYKQADRDRSTEPGYVQSIVVLTDGVSNEGMSIQEFAREHYNLRDDAKKIRIFGVLFGNDADGKQIEDMARISGGAVFDGSKSLSAAFKKIRGYQ
jgi:Ca-activated chloride channel homolog